MRTAMRGTVPAADSLRPCPNTLTKSLVDVAVRDNTKEKSKSYFDLQADSLNTWGSGPLASDGILDSVRFSTVSLSARSIQANDIIGL